MPCSCKPTKNKTTYIYIEREGERDAFSYITSFLSKTNEKHSPACHCQDHHAKKNGKILSFPLISVCYCRRV
jgi:hypothetical protein